MTATKPIQIFSCYAQPDKFLLEELKNHLAPLERRGDIRLRDNLGILPGAVWRREVTSSLNSANIILLLISSDFIASDYSYDVELKKALERERLGQARVIPIIVRSVSWKATPIGKLKVLPDNGIPVTDPFWSSRDVAFNHVAQEIERVVDELLGRRTNRPPGAAPFPSFSSNTASQGQQRMPPGNTAPQGQRRTSPGNTASQGHQWTFPSNTAPQGQQQTFSNPFTNRPISMNRSKFIVAAIVVLVFVCSITSCILSSIHLPPTRPSSGNSSSSTQSTSTPFDMSGSLKTSVAQIGPLFATETAVAQSFLNSAYPDPYPPVWNNVLLADPLNQAEYWQDNVSSANNSTCKFSGSAYHITQAASQGFYKCVASVSDSPHFTFEVTMTILQGDCGGIIFHADFALNNYYIFSICENRDFSLVRYTSQSPETLASGSSVAIHAGQNIDNTIAIAIDDKNFNLYVNKTNIKSVSISQASTGSQFGLVALSQGNQTEVAYVDATVWGP
jgi:hypothetical protein